MGFFRQSSQFCWVDIKTSDMQTTKDFYSELFGWDFKDETFAGRVYTKIYLGKEELGGLTDLKSSIFPKETPSHVSIYVAVQNVDKTASQVIELGGEVLLEPSDVMQEGRMATIKDPTGGAVFSLWEAKKFRGMNTDINVEGAPSWFELMTTDITASAEFYSKLFQWTLETPSKSGFTHALFKNKEEYVSGLKAIPIEMGLINSQWLVCFTVENFDGTLEKSQLLGAKIVYKNQYIPSIGRLAMFISPDGLLCSIIEKR